MAKFAELVQERIKALRKERKLTQQDLADKLKVDRVLVARWETGTMPHPESLDRIAQALGVNVWDLCTPPQTKDDRRLIDIEDCFLAVMEYTQNKILEDLQRLGKSPRRDPIPFDSTVKKSG